MLVLGWLLAIIFYLLGALALFLIDFDCIYTLPDWLFAIGLSLIWPVFVIGGAWVIAKDKVDGNRQRQERVDARL